MKHDWWKRIQTIKIMAWYFFYSVNVHLFFYFSFYLLNYEKYEKRNEYDNTFIGDLENSEQSYI